MYAVYFLTFQLTFINATKAFSLKESQQLVSITNDMLKMDIENCVNLSKPDSGLFDSLLFSKLEKGSRTTATHSASKDMKNAGMETADHTSKWKSAKGKLNSMSLAQKIMKQRKSLVPESCKEDTKLINRCFGKSCSETKVVEFIAVEEEDGTHTPETQPETGKSSKPTIGKRNSEISKKRVSSTISIQTTEERQLNSSSGNNSRQTSMSTEKQTKQTKQRSMVKANTKQGSHKELTEKQRKEMASKTSKSVSSNRASTQHPKQASESTFKRSAKQMVTAKKNGKSQDNLTSTTSVVTPRAVKVKELTLEDL